MKEMGGREPVQEKEEGNEQPHTEKRQETDRKQDPEDQRWKEGKTQA